MNGGLVMIFILTTFKLPTPSLVLLFILTEQTMQSLFCSLSYFFVHNKNIFGADNTHPTSLVY